MGEEKIMYLKHEMNIVEFDGIDVFAETIEGSIGNDVDEGWFKGGEEGDPFD